VAGDLRGLFRGQVRTLFEAGTVTGLTDGQLLERFATRRDLGSELAFTALVERHGPMVLRACRGILRDDHEAMDAFQATFLVLARKGGSLWVRDSIGPWLHRVACRAAGRAKRASARRLATE
jgi:DNA-directed RNA polymerase specialized sigma24 family protein